MAQTVPLPTGFLDVFAVAQLPSTHPKAFVERGGKAIRTTTEQGFLCFGQYKQGYPVMPLQAVFSILIDNNTVDDRYILILDVYDHHSDRVIGKQLITRKDFPRANELCLFSFDFTPPGPEANMEFRIYYMGYAYVLANKIAVIDPAQISIAQPSEIPEIAVVPEPPKPTPEIPKPAPELPAPWKVKAIGNGAGKVTLRKVEFAQVNTGKGELEYSALFDVEANGAIRDAADNFYFLYQEWSDRSGNGKVVANFTSREGFAGIMYRESLDPDSRFIMLEKNRILSRDTRGGRIVERVIPGISPTTNELKLVRKKEGFYLVAMQEIPFALPRKAYVGLAAGTVKATVAVGTGYKDSSIVGSRKLKGARKKKRS